MARPSTALVAYDIPGRRRGGVRVLQPASGKASYRVLWTDDAGRQRERTRTVFEGAEALAESIATDLAAQQPVRGLVDPTLGDLLIYHLDGPGRSKKWRSEKSARRPAQIARRLLAAADLAMPASRLVGPEGHAVLTAIMQRAQQRGCRPGSSEYAKAGGLLKTLLDIAERDDLLAMPAGNPMTAIPYRLHDFAADPDPRMLTVHYVGEELRPPTDRVLEFIDATEKRFGWREARYVETLAFAGTRPGEANALTVRQLRTDRPGLLIDQQVLELTAGEAVAIDGDSLPFRLPKWQRQRNAFLPPRLLNDLRTIAESHRLGPHGVLFPSPRGQIRRQGNWRRDVFNPIAAHVGWPTQDVVVRGRQERHWVWPVYGFRHHYANYLLKDLNQPLVSVARFLGHRDVRVTERMYLKTELSDLDVAAAAHTNGIYGDRI